MPTFSIIIPVKPGGAVKALEPLRRLQGSPFEILIAEGKQPSRQRNTAARQAAGDILCFLDDDSLVSWDYLAQCEETFRDPSVAVAGGPSLTPTDDSPLQQLFGLAISSLFGAGGVRNRYRRTGPARETNEKELILCNLAFRRQAFLDAGGFDERLYPNEENELLDRIAASGRKLLHVPALAVSRSQRSSLKAFARQMFSYGRGRAQQTHIAGPASPMAYVPLVFLLYILLYPWLPCVMQLPLFAYLLLDLIFAGAAAVSSRRVSALLLVLLFPLMHLCNGAGLLYGFCRPATAPAGDPEITIRRIKAMDGPGFFGDGA